MKPELAQLERALIEAGIAQSDPERMHGAVCFVESPRLPVAALFESLEDGGTVEEFLENYPASLASTTITGALEVQRRLSAPLAAGVR